MSKGVDGQVHCERKCENCFFFRAYICQKWTDLRQTKTKMIIGQF